MVTGSIASQFAEGFGLAAAAIAVCGFLAHAGPALVDADERRLRKATIAGGFTGLCISAVVIVLSELAG